MSILGLFGDSKELLRQGSGGPEKVNIDVLVKESETQVVGLYFSAHWCPPCRAFTPVLAEWYKKFKENYPDKDFEIVFVSSDREESAFNDYYKEMPWLALPYAARDVKGKLSSKFKVSGIPTLVFLDGKTGKQITKDGRNIVTEDPEGNDFPWVPKRLNEILAGTLVNKDKEMNWSDVTEDVIGLYFSAHWCGPCRAFTPELIKSYKKLQEDNKSFKIIFVSSDRDQDAFQEYYDSMPWLAIPFGDKRKKLLSAACEVSGIPTLIIMKKTGEIITKNGRSAISADPDGKDFPWVPKPVNPLSSNTAGDINDNLSLIYYIKDKDSGKEIRDAMETIAKTHIDSNPDERVYFFYHSSDEDEDDVGSSLKSFAGASEEHNLVIMNIPSQSRYTSTANGIADLKEIWDKLVSGKLEMKPLRA